MRVTKRTPSRPPLSIPLSISVYCYTLCTQCTASWPCLFYCYHSCTLRRNLPLPIICLSPVEVLSVDSSLLHRSPSQTDTKSLELELQIEILVELGCRKFSLAGWILEDKAGVKFSWSLERVSEIWTYPVFSLIEKKTYYRAKAINCGEINILKCLARLWFIKSKVL